MSLVRCPGCRIDTSDSLAHCPSCGAVLHGSGPRLFDQRPAVVPERQLPASLPAVSPLPVPEPASIETATVEPSPPPATTLSFQTGMKVVGAVVGLVFAFAPKLLPIVVIAIVFWLIARSRGAGGQSRQVEALRIVVNEVTRARSQGSKERPLEMLRRIEKQLKETRRT